MNATTTCTIPVTNQIVYYIFLLVFCPFYVMVLQIALYWVKVTHTAPDGRSFSYVKDALGSIIIDKAEHGTKSDRWFKGARVTVEEYWDGEGQSKLIGPTMCLFVLMKDRFDSGEMNALLFYQLGCAPLALYILTWWVFYPLIFCHRNYRFLNGGIVNGSVVAVKDQEGGVV
jgi:hypothetical protein